MDTNSVRCDRCNMIFSPGDPAWRMKLTLSSDPEQGLSEYADLTEGGLDERLDALLQRIEMIPQEILDAQVYQEFQFVLCARCRGIIAANPLNQPLSSGPPSGD